MLLLMLTAARASATDSKGQAASRSCAFSDAEFDPSTDVHALDRYRDAIAQLLKQEKFGDLDCVADAARAGKNRFAGGAWKLANIYEGLDSPRHGTFGRQDTPSELNPQPRDTDSTPDRGTNQAVNRVRISARIGSASDGGTDRNLSTAQQRNRSPRP